MLTTSNLHQILDRIPSLTIGVLGDLFLDRYLDLDAGLTEASVETGLDAYQVTRVRCYPGAAGTVINNLAALGVKRIVAISVIGDDGEGYELRRGLAALGCVEDQFVYSTTQRRTPTYTKPMLFQADGPGRELNRLDIKNRTRLAAADEDRILQALDRAWPKVDGLLVLDQVSEADCGVITERVRDHLRTLSEVDPERWVLADSREHIGLFRSVWAKPNRSECQKAVMGSGDARSDAEALARQVGRPVFCTCGEEGILVVDPRPAKPQTSLVAGYPVSGPIDIVGAGDSTSAGIACALAAGATLEEAAAFGNMVASITIQQIGVTGTATPAQVRERWQQVNRP